MTAHNRKLLAEARVWRKISLARELQNPHSI
jgi:hypothetical protein